MKNFVFKSSLIFVSIMLAAHVALANVQWPPRLGTQYPDLELIDQQGNPVRISDFKGKVIFVEYIGMTCPACNALSGAQKFGQFQNIVPQAGLQSIEEYFTSYTGGLRLTDERIIFIQIILYNMAMKAPSLDDVKQWAKHFQLERSQNEIVLAGTPELVGPASFKLIPGFQLIDKDFYLRSDSTGHRPQHNLYTHLLPLVPELINEQ